MVDKTIVQGLSNLGLSNKQALVYLAALEGTSTVAELAERANLKRPTAYIMVGELKIMGLLSETKRGTKTFYQAVNPAALQELATGRLKTIEAILPQLESLRLGQAGRPRMEILEGEVGIRAVYVEMLKQSEIIFWTDIKTLINKFPEMWEGYFRRVKGGYVQVKELVEDSAIARRYARSTNKINPKVCEVRVAKNLLFYGDFFVFGDVIVLVSLKENNYFVVRIENPDFAESMRTLFNLAWASAKKV